METRACSLFVVFLIFECSGILRVDCLLNCTDKLTACQCQGPGIDINIEDAFDYPYNITSNPTGDNPQKYSYYFSPCAPLDSCGTVADKNAVVMCQHNLLSPDNRDVSLGVGLQVEWDGNSDKDFIIRYKGGDSDDKKGRWTEIQVTVPGNDDVIEFVGEDDTPSDHITYKFTMTLKSDVPNINTGAEPPVGYAGIAIILIAIASLILYFVIGAVFLYYVRGARGLEAFPNYAFWKELPILIKDGCCFTISPCRDMISKKGKYQPL